MGNFGLPRVGNKLFSDFQSTIIPDTFRVVHKNDIVPHLPPQWVGFHHVKTEVWANEDQDVLKVCDGSGEDPSCSDSVYGDSVEDHLHYLNVTMNSRCAPATLAAAKKDADASARR